MTLDWKGLLTGAANLSSLPMKDLSMGVFSLACGTYTVTHFRLFIEVVACCRFGGYPVEPELQSLRNHWGRA